MRRALILILGLGFNVAGAGEKAGSETDPAGSLHTLPNEISQFYRDLNFASSYSTPRERGRLRLVADLERAEDLSDRLRRVGELIRVVEDRIQKIDSGMVVSPGGTDSVPSVLSEPVDVRREGTTMFLTVNVWPLSLEQNARFVAFYGRSDDMHQAPDAWKFKTLFDQVPRTEIHKWMLVDGKWMHWEANVVLLR